MQLVLVYSQVIRVTSLLKVQKSSLGLCRQNQCRLIVIQSTKDQVSKPPAPMYEAKVAQAKT